MTAIRNHERKLALVAALTAVALFASPPLLLAQPAPAAPGQSAQPADAKGVQRNAIEHVDAKIAELHKKLRITPAQEPQFNAYADVMRSNAQAMDALFAERAQSTGTKTVEPADKRLHWYARLTAAHADAVNKLVPVFDTLYQSLADDQKKIADAVFREHLQQRRMPHRHRTHHKD